MRNKRLAGAIVAGIILPIVLISSVEAPETAKPALAAAASKSNPGLMLLPPRAAESVQPVEQISRSDMARGRDLAAKHVAHRKAVARAKALAEKRAAEARAARQRAASRSASRTASIGGGAGYVGMAVAIARCESGGDPHAQNAYSSASGLYQFIDSTWASASGLAPPASAYSIATQTAVFWKVWNGGKGSGNWSPSRSCWG